jgi:hypothetical protein
MKTVLRKFGVQAVMILLLIASISSIASASELGGGGRRGGGGRYSVAEPAAVVLLGAGLISLGIYAKRKRAKK